MQVKLKPIKQLYNNENNKFRVLSCEPVGSYENLELSKYGNFTLSGVNISKLEVGKQYELEIEKAYKSKYPASYVMIRWAAIKIDKTSEKTTIEPSQEVGFLEQFMENSQAKNVHEAYPNFVQMILDGKENEFNVKTIRNVGTVRLTKYIEDVKSHLHSLAYYPIASSWGIMDVKQIELLSKLFLTPEAMKSAFEVNPYTVLFTFLNFSFAKADRTVLSKHPELAHSGQRCELGCLEILRQNESEGDTRIDADLFEELVAEIVPECADLIQDTMESSEEIYYDKKTQYVSMKKTYDAEKLIADELLERINNPKSLHMDWAKFRKLDSFDCTDEQAEILRLANEQRVCMLRGNAGCVDADTEFFDGKGWKRIADYKEGDKVLQYDIKNNRANLATPEAYIKIPCNEFYQIGGRNGIQLCLSEEHNVLWYDNENNWHKTRYSEVLKTHNNRFSGFNGKIRCAFNYHGKGINLTGEQIELMIAVITNGQISKRNQACNVYLNSKKKADKLKDILDRSETEYSECYDVEAQSYIFSFQPPVSEAKFLPYWYNCNEEQFDIIRKNILDWGENNQYSTTLKENADFVQFLFSSGDSIATISTEESDSEAVGGCRETEYVVTIDKKWYSYIGGAANGKPKSDIKTIKSKDGFKYCFTMPQGTLVLRKDDKIFTTFNCGKSSAMKALVLMLEHYGQDYLLLAPTGVAAKRLKETTGRPASTIHMFLALHSDDTVSDKVVLIDESSIMGVHLLADLLCVLDKTCRIVFICDEAQLASIACGNVVQDIIDSGVVPTARLTKIFRYGSSGLATIATDTRNGKIDSRIESNFDDYHFYPAKSNPINQIVEIYRAMLNKGYTKDDILILCPFNKGRHGTYAINNAIQKEFNKHPDTKAGREINGQTKIMFKIGDKVLNTKNNYSMPCYDFEEDGEPVEGAKKVFVANGEIGYVRGICETGGGIQLEVEFGENLACVRGEDINHLLLGYAETIHRVQGTEAKAVIMFTSNLHKRMLSKNLLYVGDSRAKEMLVEVGDISAIEAGLMIEENKERDTFLKELLENG